jgi:hypothetical protein
VMFSLQRSVCTGQIAEGGGQKSSQDQEGNVEGGSWNSIAAFSFSWENLPNKLKHPIQAALTSVEFSTVLRLLLLHNPSAFTPMIICQ